MISGATTHAKFCKDFCTSYTLDDFIVVRIGNNSVAKVVNLGNVCTHYGMRLLKYVKYVSDIQLNIIFVDKLDDEGYYSSFGNGQWKLIKGSLVIARCKRNPNLYMM